MSGFLQPARVRFAYWRCGRASTAAGPVFQTCVATTTNVVTSSVEQLTCAVVFLGRWSSPPLDCGALALRASWFRSLARTVLSLGAADT